MTTRSSRRERALRGGRSEPGAPPAVPRAWPSAPARSPPPPSPPSRSGARRPSLSRVRAALMAMSSSVSSGSGTGVNEALIARPVQVGVELARGLAREPGDSLELLSRGADDGLGRAEVVEQGALPRRPDAGQVVEQGGGHRTVAARAVVGDGEAVRLVAHPLEELQRGRVVTQDDRLAPAGDEDLLDALGERDDRDAARAEALERPQAGAQLARPAVDDDQVRQRRERLVALWIVRA